MMKWYQKEDNLAFILALGVVFLISALWFFAKFELYAFLNVKFHTWDSANFAVNFNFKTLLNLLIIFIAFSAVFSLCAFILGKSVKSFLLGFFVLFLLAILVFLLSSHKIAKDLQLESPLIALFIGLILANFIKIPPFLQNALMSEFYVKLGIIFMGATLSLNLIANAALVAIIQACIITCVTFFAIYFIATKFFKLEKPFGATLAAGGSICGVSAAIVIGNSCKAKPEHISATISIVVFWAVIMIFVLPFVCSALNLDAAVAGAFIGSSEFADAAGFAAAASLNDDRAIAAFTMMKVIGRDAFIGVWAVGVALVSLKFWQKDNSQNLQDSKLKIIWQKFPNFILAFILASIFTSVMIFMINDISSYQNEVVKTLKNLRNWVFSLCFLSIGLSTNFRTILQVGYKPFLAFSLGALINLAIGFTLCIFVFSDFWLGFLVEAK